MSVCLSVCTYLSIYLSNYPRIYIYVGQSSLFGGLRESLPDQPKISSFHPPRKKSSRLEWSKSLLLRFPPPNKNTHKVCEWPPVYTGNTIRPNTLIWSDTFTNCINKMYECVTLLQK